MQAQYTQSLKACCLSLMKALSRKCLLAVVVSLCLVPASFAGKPNHDQRCDPRRRDCQQVPEGGSAIVYVLGTAVTCLGAMLIRSRSAKLSKS
jgi:hypothetical protein